MNSDCAIRGQVNKVQAYTDERILGKSHSGTNSNSFDLPAVSANGMSSASGCKHQSRALYQTLHLTTFTRPIRALLEMKGYGLKCFYSELKYIE